MDKKKFLMTEGTIWKVLLRFAIPLFFGRLFQQLYTTVDSWVVAHFCGDSALAAVSSSSSLCFLMIGFFQGVFTGGSIIISRYYGAQNHEKTETAIHTLVVFSLIFGTVLTVLGVIFSPTLLRWMGTPDNVMPDSVIYLRIYCMGILALVLYNTANGIFQALGDSKHPLYYLIIASVANVILDLLFVAVFDWGVGGAALATALGQLLSAVLAFIHLMSGRFIVQIKLSKLIPDGKTMKQIFRLGLPSGVQNSVISLANVVVQSNVNAFGNYAMAGCGSYAKVEGFVFLPIMSLTMALSTFISQNLGANKPERAKKGAIQGTAMALCFVELMGIAYFIWAPAFISIFSSTPEVIYFGVTAARTTSLFFCFVGLSHCCAAILRGAGRTVFPMIVMLSVWCLLRIVYITIIVRFIPHIAAVYSAYPLTWFTSSVIFLIYLKKSNWTETKNII